MLHSHESNNYHECHETAGSSLTAHETPTVSTMINSNTAININPTPAQYFDNESETPSLSSLMSVPLSCDEEGQETNNGLQKSFNNSNVGNNGINNITSNEEISVNSNGKSKGKKVKNRIIKLIPCLKTKK